MSISELQQSFAGIRSMSDLGFDQVRKLVIREESQLEPDVIDGIEDCIHDAGILFGDVVCHLVIFQRC